MMTETERNEILFNSVNTYVATVVIDGVDVEVTVYAVGIDIAARKARRGMRVTDIKEIRRTHVRGRACAV